MDSVTYQAVKQAGLYGIIDKPRLKKRKTSTIPAIQQKIDYILKNVSFSDPDWGLDLSRFRDQFRGVSAKDRLDEVIVTFILFIGNQYSEEKINQTFILHGLWDREYFWSSLFKYIVYSIFTLMYDVKWQSEYFFWMDEMATDIKKGEATPLRKFAERIGIYFESHIYPAEIHYTKMDYHNSRVFGPYFWRMLHWMAEAFAVRSSSGEDMVFAKKLWREFTTESLHRTLRCSICIGHYKNLLDNQEWKSKILETPDSEFPKLWFDIHNKVNWHNETSYKESEFQLDREFMLLAIPTVIG